MDAVLPGLGALTVFVEDLESSASFYGDVLGLRDVHQGEDSAVFAVGPTLLNLLDVTAARELVEPAPVAPPGVGARMQLTAWVDDVDAVCDVLRSRGVALLNGPVDRPWGKRTAAFTDPAGTVWEVAQDLPAREAG
ncbi:MAG: VOC family protein [Actinomycetota bacterium]|nr:VOC family protein [Actinomycetota bacterium]